MKNGHWSGGNNTAGHRWDSRGGEDSLWAKQMVELNIQAAAADENSLKTTCFKASYTKSITDLSAFTQASDKGTYSQGKDMQDRR